MDCIRCGRTEPIEKHHIVERRYGGGDEAENKEYRCCACHDYEHTRRAILGVLEKERERGQKDRIRVYEHRLEVLDRLNTPELIRERGTYLSYWTDTSTQHLPRRIPTKKESELETQIEMLVDTAQQCIAGGAGG